MMYSRDGMTAEDGFGDLLAHVEEHTEDLIAAFRAELTSSDPNPAMQSWLLELISESRSEAALPTLVEGARRSERHGARSGLPQNLAGCAEGD
ncbi:hypothetical protein ADL15_36995 [Actinoplanes awajinensis subsp. mycoplanecinus]|uniref:Uncharacterized protein n=2 Tax=Actinoplanes awajinensis TaxID=135946 RepID=A0A117MNE8_9ACTN|nr:hypothetical protein ADL15_36995 [Actinoplanes awajinensis subsp. mycoplanecinus]